MDDFFIFTLLMFSMISTVSFITTRKILINKLKKGESVLVTEVITTWTGYLASKHAVC